MTAVASGSYATPACSSSSLARIVTAGAFAAGTAYVGLVNPSRGVFPLCPFHAVTGLWCPGCGATRAAHALLHGHLVTALHDNLLFVLALPFVVVGLLRWFTGRIDRLPRVPAALTSWAFGIAATFGVLRNLPVFHALAPLR